METLGHGFSLLVVGLDGSPEAAHAHGVASMLARRCGARLTAVGADGAGDLPAGAERVPGLPGIELPRFAESVAADLLVLGRRPRHASGPPLGAVGDAVVRRSRVPSLLLPGHVPEIRRVLLALDPGPRGGVVRDFALRFCREMGAELCWVSVRRIPGADRGHGGGQALGLSGDPAGAFRGRWREGEISTEILAEAEEVGADVIAFGVHRGGPLGGVEQRGVSHHLVREARTALLTVPL
jgi:nucleotide-binding universal stress UspA family protein